MAIRRLLLVFVLAVLLGALLVACGDDSDDTDAAADPSTVATVPEVPTTGPDGPLGAGPYAVADMSIHYSNPDADVDLTYRITCQGDTASMSGDDVGVTAERACTALADDAVVGRLVNAPPPDQVCTQIYGGADVADITGDVDGQSVAAQITRENGCAIDDWDNVLVDLLPTPVGA